MNVAKTLIIAGGSWLAWEALKSVMGAVSTVQTAAAKNGTALDPSMINPDATQGADYSPSANLLPPYYGPMGPPTTDQLPVAIPVSTTPTVQYNPPDPPATIVATNPAAANPPSSSVLPSTTPVQSPTLPAADTSSSSSTATPAPQQTTTQPATTTTTPAPAPAVVQVSPYSAAGAGRLAPGQVLVPGYVIQSPVKGYRLTLLQDSGRLWLTDPGNHWLWNSSDSETKNKGIVKAYMNPNGYLQLLRADNAVVWQRGNGTPNSALHVQDDGNTVLYAPNGAMIWSTGTAGR